MEREDFAEASTLDASSLPLVDVSASLGTDDPSAVADALFEAATDVGFFYLVGHGIDPALTARAFAAARDFFALPETAKRTVAVGTDQRGWMAGGMSRLEGSESPRTRVASTHDLGVAAVDVRHEPVTAGEYIQGRNRRSFAQYAGGRSMSS